MCNWCFTHNKDRDDREDREQGMKETEGTNKSKYDPKDSQRDTKATDKEQSEAWHQARDDAEEIGWVPPNRHEKK